MANFSHWSAHFVIILFFFTFFLSTDIVKCRDETAAVKYSKNDADHSFRDSDVKKLNLSAAAPRESKGK